MPISVLSPTNENNDLRRTGANGTRAQCEQTRHPPDVTVLQINEDHLCDSRLLERRRDSTADVSDAFLLRQDVDVVRKGERLPLGASAFHDRLAEVDIDPLGANYASFRRNEIY